MLFTSCTIVKLGCLWTVARSFEIWNMYCYKVAYVIAIQLFMEWQKLSNFWKSSILFSPNNTTHIMRLQMCCPFTVTWQSQILMLGCWCVNFMFSFRCVIFMFSFRCFLWDRRIDLKLSLLSEILYKSVSDFEQVKPFERPLWEPEQDYFI